MKQSLYIIFVFFFWNAALAGSSEFTLKGSIKDKAGTKLGKTRFKVEQFNDFITAKPKVIYTGTTDRHGNFDAKIKLNTTSFIQINFGKVQRTLYAQPTHAYYIEVDAPFSKLKKMTGKLVNDVRPAKITNTYKNELNSLIANVDSACTHFLYHRGLDRRDYKKVLAFCDSTQKKYNSKFPYFNQYLHFKLAEVQLFIHRNNRSKFFKKFIKNKKSISYNAQSMHVLTSFFRGYMKNDLGLNKKHPIHKKITSGDYPGTLKAIYKDSASTELRELILLNGFFEIYNSQLYELKVINPLLDSLIAKTLFPNHKIIAQNIKRNINNLKPGSTAPPIALKSSFEKFNMDKYKGKYIYVCFFYSWDATFLEELKIIDFLQSRYGKQLQVVCIAADDDLKKYKELKKQYHKKKWIFMHYSFNNDLLSDYNIESFRLDRYEKTATSSYYLIGPKQKMIFSPSKAPSQGFEIEFRKLIEN